MSGRGAPRLYPQEVVDRGRALWMGGSGDQAIAGALNAEFPQYGGNITKPTVQSWRRREQWPPRESGPLPFELEQMRNKLRDAMEDIGDLQLQVTELQGDVADRDAYIRELERALSELGYNPQELKPNHD